MTKTFKPGETAERSGEYEIRGPRGGTPERSAQS
jgi:hypothetical protein